MGGGDTGQDAARTGRAGPLLLGDIKDPVLRLPALKGLTHPATGQPLDAWIRGLPRARRVRGRWQVRAVGADPLQVFADAGVIFEAELADAVGSVAGPLVDLDPGDTTTAVVWPRLTGLQHTLQMCLDTLGADDFRDRVTVTDPALRLPVELAGVLPFPRTRRIEDVLVPPAVWRLPATPPPVAAAATRLAASLGASPDTDSADVDVLAGWAGPVPDWFAVSLDPHQKAGALAAAAGHTLIADPPGLGKTHCVLAALAITGSTRSVIVTPPHPVISHWEREVTRCGLAEHSGTGGRVLVLDARQRDPVLPPCGVLLVPDTLLAARPELVDRIAEWRPIAFAVDEAHRIKTWDSLRSRAVRRLARQCTGIRMAATGTPMLSNVVEMVPMLAVTGHLDTVFGGRRSFQAAYARENRFGGWVNRSRELPRLRALLDQRVWVRRPKVMGVAKTRRVAFIDPDRQVLAEANRDAYRTIDTFLRRQRGRTGAWPDRDTCLTWVRGQMGLTTQLRRAAGLAKAAVIARRAADWVTAQTRPGPHGERICVRPLIVWTWHREVADEIAHVVSVLAGDGSPGPAVGVITGATPGQQRTRLCDEYQAGRLPLLVCSIPTVGVGVTLTRGCDAWLAETSWTPSELSQAEDRQHRRGQRRDVEVTTFIGVGTLDERVQDTLGRKAEDLDRILAGGDNQVAVLGRSSRAEQADLLYGVVADRIAALDAVGRTPGRSA